MYTPNESTTTKKSSIVYRSNFDHLVSYAKVWRLVCARQSPSSCFITSADHPIHQSKRIQAIKVVICEYILYSTCSMV